MQRRARTLAITVSLAVVILGTTEVSATTRMVRSMPQAAPPLQETQGLADGISVDMLASQDGLAPWTGGSSMDMSLERVPLDPGDNMDGRDPDESGGGSAGHASFSHAYGMHLLYIETGEVVVSTSDGAATYQQGESAFVPQPDVPSGERPPSYDLRNDSIECASVLRLSVVFFPPGFAGQSQAPRGPERGCGTYEFLFNSNGTYPWPENPPAELPINLFIERLSWEEDSRLSDGSWARSGPVVLLVESGRLVLRFGDPSVVRTDLPAAGVAMIDAGIPHQGYGTAGTAALAVGIAPVDP
jgi:hypothetical protein